MPPGTFKIRRNIWKKRKHFSSCMTRRTAGGTLKRYGKSIIRLRNHLNFYTYIFRNHPFGDGFFMDVSKMKILVMSIGIWAIPEKVLEIREFIGLYPEGLLKMGKFIWLYLRILWCNIYCWYSFACIR